MPNKVVVHYLDGNVERGYTTDFQPNKEIFHLIVEDNGEKSILVKIINLKAVFFVKNLKGLNKTRVKAKRSFEEIKDKKMIGRKVKVEFTDGEVLFGITLGYSANRRGFFFTPIDPESNNERIFAIINAVKDITFYE